MNARPISVQSIPRRNGYQCAQAAVVHRFIGVMRQQRIADHQRGNSQPAQRCDAPLACSLCCDIVGEAAQRTENVLVVLRYRHAVADRSAWIPPAQFPARRSNQDRGLRRTAARQGQFDLPQHRDSELRSSSQQLPLQCCGAGDGRFLLSSVISNNSLVSRAFYLFAGLWKI